jgi:hypothetical protein
VSDERDLLDHLVGDAASGIAQDQGVTELEPEDPSRIDPAIDAGDHEQGQAGHGRELRVDTGPGERVVAFEQRIEVGHRWCLPLACML